MDDHGSLNDRQKNFIRFMDMNGLELRDVERITGVGYSTLAAYRSNPNQSMTDRIRDKILAGFHCSDEDIFRDPKRLDVFDSGHASKSQEDTDKIYVAQIDLKYGMGGVYQDVEYNPTHMTFSRGWIRQLTSAPPEAIFWASGMGDSMSPTISDGDILLIDTSQQMPRMRDQIWALSLYGQGMVKRLRATGDGWLIQSDNPNVRDERAIDGEMEIMGRVVAIVRRV